MTCFMDNNGGMGRVHLYQYNKDWRTGVKVIVPPVWAKSFEAFGLTDGIQIGQRDWGFSFESARAQRLATLQQGSAVEHQWETNMHRKRGRVALAYCTCAYMHPDGCTYLRRDMICSVCILYTYAMCEHFHVYIYIYIPDMPYSSFHLGLIPICHKSTQGLAQLFQTAWVLWGSLT